MCALPKWSGSVLMLLALQSIASEPKSYVYKIVDGNEIYADVSMPQGEGPHPAILFLHGGALIEGSRQWILPWQRETYIDAGFVFVSIDYRLAPETKLPEILADLADGYDWLRNRGASMFNIDPDAISVVGHSAGGYLALLSGYRLSPRPKSVVSFYGYGDITGDWYTTPSPEFLGDGEISEREARSAVGDTLITGTPFDMEHRRGDFYVWTRQQGNWPREVTGREPDGNVEWFRSFEPVHNVSSEYPPTLLLHGEADLDVPFEQSEAMAKALERHYVSHRLISNESWGHMFDGPEQTEELEELFDVVIRFLTD